MLKYILVLLVFLGKAFSETCTGHGPTMDLPCFTKDQLPATAMAQVNHYSFSFADGETCFSVPGQKNHCWAGSLEKHWFFMWPCTCVTPTTTTTTTTSTTTTTEPAATTTSDYDEYEYETTTPPEPSPSSSQCLAQDGSVCLTKDEVNIERFPNYAFNNSDVCFYSSIFGRSVCATSADGDMMWCNCSASATNSSSFDYDEYEYETTPPPEPSSSSEQCLTDYGTVCLTKDEVNVERFPTYAFNNSDVCFYSPVFDRNVCATSADGDMMWCNCSANTSSWEDGYDYVVPTEEPSDDGYDYVAPTPGPEYSSTTEFSFHYSYHSRYPSGECRSTSSNKLCLTKDQVDLDKFPDYAFKDGDTCYYSPKYDDRVCAISADGEIDWCNCNYCDCTN